MSHTIILIKLLQQKPLLAHLYYRVHVTTSQMYRYCPFCDPYSSRFCSLPKHITMGEMALHIKWISFIISTFSCISLDDVRFH